MNTIPNDVARSMAWSKHCLNLAEDVIKDLFREIPNLFENDELIIRPVEGVKENLLEELDRKCGIDYFITNKTGNKWASFAWRACNTTQKRIDEEGLYNAFSLRERRNKESSKAENCEIAKRLFALEHDLDTPKYTVEAYFIKEKDMLVSAAIAKTKDVYKAYLKCPVRISTNYFDRQVFMRNVSWEIMKQYGYKVYDWYLNDKCKRTYRLEEYHKLVS